MVEERNVQNSASSRPDYFQALRDEGLRQRLTFIIIKIKRAEQHKVRDDRDIRDLVNDFLLLSRQHSIDGCGFLRQAGFGKYLENEDVAQ
ncbi:hypothetical protein GOV10_05230 [Candidatus Woesearchaeota archaeon]|nr:hypothetical protein [Candidatus Woesearchaeota archaeon]